MSNSWDSVYELKGAAERSWTEGLPSESIEIITRLDVASSDAIIDIGGGASGLVDALLERGHTDVTVLDISSRAIAEARTRVEQKIDRGAHVEWICADVTAWVPARRYAVWHDRAAFHFLIAEQDQLRYVERVRHALLPGGYLVLACFAPSGPESCSGYPVVRWDPSELASLLRKGFAPIESFERIHVTPWGATQPFSWSVFRVSKGS